MKLGKRNTILIISIFLSIISTLCLVHQIKKTERNLRKGKKTIRVIVAGTDIPKDSSFNETNLMAMEIPEKLFFPLFIHEDDLNVISGAKARNNIQKGNPVVWNDIKDPVETERFSVLIDNGKRAISLPAGDTSSLASLIRPGDRVDIYLTRKVEGKEKLNTILLLEDIEVGALDSNYIDISLQEMDTFSPSTVTLLVSKIQAACLLKAKSDSSSKLDIVLRNPEERKRKKNLKVKTISNRIEIFKSGDFDRVELITRAIHSRRSDGSN